MTREEKQTHESETKQKQILLDELSKMPLTVISTAYLYARYLYPTNYTMHEIHDINMTITEKWETAKENARALEIAYRKGYNDAMKRVAESEVEK